MEGIASALAAQQAAFSDRMSLVAVKMNAQAQAQMVAMLAEVAQQMAANPPHLGQAIDTYA